VAVSDQNIEKEYKALQEAFNDGSIIRATKTELERYATIMALRRQAATSLGQSELDGYPDMLGLLLIVRVSEEANKQATIIALVALAVASASFLVAVAQALVAKGIL
jgi:hypothetical protein